MSPSESLLTLTATRCCRGEIHCGNAEARNWSSKRRYPPAQREVLETIPEVSSSVMIGLEAVAFKTSRGFTTAQREAVLAGNGEGFPDIRRVYDIVSSSQRIDCGLNGVLVVGTLISSAATDWRSTHRGDTAPTGET